MTSFKKAFVARTSVILLLIIAIIKVTVTTVPVQAAEQINAPVDPVVGHIAEVRDIGLDEAEERADWQEQATTLNEELENSLPPEDFGGIWIGEADDRVKIGLANDAQHPGSSRNIIDTKVAALGLQEAVDYIPVNYYFAELKAATEWINDSLGLIDRTDLWPIQVGITTNTNQTVITLPADNLLLSNAEQVLVSEAQNRFGNMIRIERYVEMPKAEACNMIYCDGALRGGVGISGSNNYLSLWCTSGFIVQGDSGQRYMLTAGHCVNGSAGVGGGNGWATRDTLGTLKRIGPIHRNEFGQDSVDAMIVEIRDIYGWDTRGWVYMRSGQGLGGYSGPSYNETYVINGTNSSGGLVGDRVCKSGAGGGSSCGPVKEVDVSATFSDGVRRINLVRAEYCSMSGDSGSSVVRLNKALGIHAGSGSGGTCSVNKFYTGVEPIIRAMDDTITVVTESL